MSYKQKGFTPFTSKKEMKRLEDVYGSMDTSNAYSGMNNSYEDLTIDENQSTANIGKQEKENQMLKAKEAARLQKLERDGEITSREDEKDKQSTLLAMQQQEVAANKETKNTAKIQKNKTLAKGIESVGSVLT
tara:strand:+ start:628 stop:1026 length:399 start_codon:yes stop_codon:yes gene_type:complete